MEMKPELGIDKEENGKHLRRLRVSRSAFQDRIYSDVPKIPPGSFVHDIYNDYDTDSIIITFYHKDLPLVPFGDIIPLYTPCVEYVENENGSSLNIYWPENWIALCQQGK